METIDHLTPLTVDGDYGLANGYEGERRRVLEVAGEFAGAVVTAGYEDLTGGFTPFRDADGVPYTATQNTFWDDVPTPMSGRLALRLADAGPTTSILWKMRAAG